MTENEEEHKLQDAGLYVFNVIIVILMIINRLNWSQIACLCTHSWPIKLLINAVCMSCAVTQYINITLCIDSLSKVII